MFQIVARQAQQHADARVDLEHSGPAASGNGLATCNDQRSKDREIARLKTNTASASVIASRVSCPLRMLQNMDRAKQHDFSS